jgi:predicted nucleic acid-binding protein
VAGVVVDASVAVKWFIAEDRAAEALALRDLDEELIAPESTLFEVFHALWEKAREGRIPRARLPELAAAVPRPYSRLVEIAALYQPAARLALRLDHPVYDCLYLALAERERATLVTADEPLFAAARRGRIKAQLL